MRKRNLMNISNIKKNEEISNIKVISCIFIITFLCRFPFWFVDVINWDETTFILMATSVLDGHLLYTDLWDIKAPLAFYSIASFMYVFGESIIAVRVFGALTVFASAYLVFMIISLFTERKVAFRFSLLIPIVMSFFWGAQTTFTEHIAVPPLLYATFIALKNESINYRNAIAIGFFVSIAALVRLNLAYAAILIGFLIIFYAKHTSLKGRTVNAILYAISGLIPVISIIGIYALNQEIDVLYKTLILAPLSYASENKSMFFAIAYMAYHLVFSVSLLPIVAILSLVGLWFMYKSENNVSTGYIKQNKLLVFATASFLSIIASGGSHSHYLLQVIPFVIIYAAKALNDLESRHTKIKIIYPLLLILSVVGSGRLYEKYQELVGNIIEGSSVLLGESYLAADVIKSQNICDYTVWALSDHIIYFHLDKKPPTPLATHPSNISKDFLVSTFYDDDRGTQDELVQIFSSQPTFLVKRDKVGYIEFNKAEELKEIMNNQLEANYDLLEKVGDLNIYILKESNLLNRNCESLQAR